MKGTNQNHGVVPVDRNGASGVSRADVDAKLAAGAHTAVPDDVGWERLGTLLVVHNQQVPVTQSLLDGDCVGWRGELEMG